MVVTAARAGRAGKPLVGSGFKLESKSESKANLTPRLRLPPRVKLKFKWKNGDRFLQKWIDFVQISCESPPRLIQDNSAAQSQRKLLSKFVSAEGTILIDESH